MLKWSFSLLICIAIGYQLFFYNNITTIFNEFLSTVWDRPTSYLCLAIGLIPFNLAFETLKWMQFTQYSFKMRFWEAHRAVLAGLSLAIVTPNRVGEYGGRLLLVPPAQRWQAAAAMVLGNYCQLLVLLFGGLVGFCWFADNYLEWQAYIIRIIWLTGGITCLTLLYGLLQIGRILPIIRKYVPKKMGRRWQRLLVFLRIISMKTKWKALQWAALRYLTYSTQYWLLLQFFGIKVSLVQGFAGIASIFLIQTAVPLSASMALLARGEIAVYVWGHFGANEISVLAATFTLFVLNIVLPALLGILFIVQKNVFKSSGYEKSTV